MKKVFHTSVLYLLILSLLSVASCNVQTDGENNNETTATQTTVDTNKVNISETLPEKDTLIPISSTFYSQEILNIVNQNCVDLLEFKAQKQTAIKAADKYLKFSYDELWEMVFGPELERSWMVKSDGICPSCKKPVIMYDWIIDPHTNPWKLKCPKCGELFPKNDFEAYYKSGLDIEGRFSYNLADDELLYNMESGDKKDKFGVDDGTGYVQDGEVFRFIQTYLIYGQWKRTILDAIKTLSNAYMYTQDTEYAVRTLILLDRLADFFPEFDYYNQGWMYEKLHSNQGYISYNIDTAFEIYDLALSYDKVVEVLFTEPRVCEFLSQKADSTGNDNKKSTPYEVKLNIDERIFKDAIKNSGKYISNPPYTDLAVFVSRAVLDWPANQKELEDEIAQIIIKNTLYDGLTGESGLVGYASMGKSAIAKLCNIFTQADPSFIEKMYRKCPKLYDAYRFHIDLLCVNKYYPILGDSSYFGTSNGVYPNSGGEENLMLYTLYELTGDEDLTKALFRANGMKSTSALTRFVTTDNISDKYRTINEIVKNGGDITLSSVRKDEYQMAVLRTGEGQDKREVWINFGTNKISHDHGDGMNIGIYYQDADFMPDNGYPNVAYGDGWYSDVVKWNRATIAHNVVSFNKQNQRRTMGNITLWSIGDVFKTLRANAPEIYQGIQKYERSLALIDIDSTTSYILDVFRVGAGPAGSYEKYSRSNISELTVEGLYTENTERDYPSYVFLDNFQECYKTDDEWTADWNILNQFNVYNYAFKIHLKMIDLTRDDNIFLADTWLPPSMSMMSQGHEGFQLPTVINEKIVEEGEIAAFVSILEPYSRESKIVQARRLNCISLNDRLEHDSNVAVEVKSVKGFTDLIILTDPDINKHNLDVFIDTEIGMVKTDAQSCMIRYDEKGNLILIRASKGSYLKIDELNFQIADTEDITEYNF